MGELSADDTAVLAGAAAGDDFDAAELFGVGSVQETLQGVEGRLGGSAVEIEGAGGGELAGAEAVPA